MMELICLQNLSTEINSTVENIGARRLHTIIEKVLDEVSLQLQIKLDKKSRLTGIMLQKILETCKRYRFV